MPRTATYKFEFFSRRYKSTGERTYYFRVREVNGEIVVPSQGYSRKVDCIQSAGHLRANLIEARFYDLDAGGKEI